MSYEFKFDIKLGGEVVGVLNGFLKLDKTVPVEHVIAICDRKVGVNGWDSVDVVCDDPKVKTKTVKK